MPVLVSLTSTLAQRRDLSATEVEAAVVALAAAEQSDADKEAFLLALTAKGESPAEIAAFATSFRARAIDPGVESWSAQAIDVVGTGGDHAGGFNISSLVTLVLASAGVVVMKHGNRGVTSKCGSADLLAGLGVNLEATPEQIRRALGELGFAFFFAPAWHPTFKAIAPTRKALASRGHRTVFNIIGPLINPGRPARTLLGVATPPLVAKLSAALDLLGSDAGLVAHGVISPDRGIDEMTTATVNLVRGTGRMRAIAGEWSAADFGLDTSPFAHLQGGDLATNLALTEAVLAGRGPTGLVDTIALNAA
ncbi:MAG: anthranilate phosphoribosyltransferase, partial [Verrucomicrobia bacterium]|nr:anthranilate phosphoribosyltransferase [Verrucomicrobiota bacterium]